MISNSEIEALIAAVAPSARVRWSSGHPNKVSLLFSLERHIGMDLGDRSLVTIYKEMRRVEGELKDVGIV